MIADLKPYPVMRDSGVVWLGEVPKGWDVLRGRQLFEIKKRISGELGHPVISVTQEGLRVKDVESGEGQLSQDYSKYQSVEVGEFAMNSMDLLTGGVGIATSPGVTSPDYRVFSIRDKSGSCDRYMLHALRMLYRNRGFYSWGQGSAQLGRWRLPRRRFNDFPFPVPSFTEQAAIARFLDWANGRLERTIRAKRKVIALLNEQKQAIIHRAVTRGLDSSVPLKPSGVPWLGGIPQHWEVRRLRAAVTDCVNGIWGGEPDGEFDLTCVRVADFDRQNLCVSLSRRTTRSIPISARTRRLLRRGDLLLEKSGGGERQPVGAVVLYDLDEPAVCSNFVARMPVAAGYHSEYVNYLHSALYANRINVPSIKQTTGIQNLDGKSYLSERVAFPDCAEQRAIALFLDGESIRFAETFSRLEREIELLREYRARLVADLVTGKLDVREAAGRLPDEALLDTAAADTDLSDEMDAADEEAVG